MDCIDKGKKKSIGISEENMRNIIGKIIENRGYRNLGNRNEKYRGIGKLVLARNQSTYTK